MGVLEDASEKKETISTPFKMSDQITHTTPDEEIIMYNKANEKSKFL